MEEMALRELDYGLSQTTCAILEAMGMVTENQRRTAQGEALAYGEKEFYALMDKYGLHHNNVITRWRSLY